MHRPKRGQIGVTAYGAMGQASGSQNHQGRGRNCPMNNSPLDKCTGLTGWRTSFRRRWGILGRSSTVGEGKAGTWSDGSAQKTIAGWGKQFLGDGEQQKCGDGIASCRT